jgi:hypothetical protein
VEPDSADRLRACSVIPRQVEGELGVFIPWRGLNSFQFLLFLFTPFATEHGVKKCTPLFINYYHS